MVVIILMVGMIIAEALGYSFAERSFVVYTLAVVWAMLYDFRQMTRRR